MAHLPSTASTSVATRHSAIECILLLVVDEELLSLLGSKISHATSLAPISVKPDATNSREASPTSSFETQRARFHRLHVSSSALSSPNDVARLIRSTNTTTVLVDLRGHPNELGLSCGFLTALKRIGFAGHVIYISVLGDLLKPDEESRVLRESYPVHAAVEVQLQNTGQQSTRGGFCWTIVGRSTVPMESPISSPISPQSGSAVSLEATSRSWREVDNFRGATNPSRSSNLSADEAPRSPESELVEGVVRAIGTRPASSSGRKIMLDLSNGRRRSFMHQTDWRPD